MQTPLFTSTNRFSVLVEEVADESVLSRPVFISTSTEEASRTHERGRREPVLNSSSKNTKKSEKPLSAPEPKHHNAFSITTVGPRYFKVVRGTGSRRQLDVPMIITNPENGQSMDVKGLLDTGCTGSCIHRDLVRRAGLTAHPFDREVEVYNADGSPNIGGSITHYVLLDVQIGNHREKLQLLVTDLGKADIFLGHEWIEHHNPSIDWQKKLIEFNRCPKECQHVIEEGEQLFMLNVPSFLQSRAVQIRARSSVAMDIAIEQNKSRIAKSFEDIVPEHYRDFRDVFDEATFSTLPEHRPWDHAIELLPDAKPYCGKIYPMSLDEQKALDDFLEENLRTDGKLRPVQDYRKLNEMTKKNKYPLPLMTELIDRLKGAKYYTKLDIRWGYNNVRMKEGDEEKAAFITNRGLYEPLVMFFGLTNSPTTFQMMMNDLFRALVLAGKVVVYLDDIIIFTNDLEEHRKIVRQVLQILRENHLSCKPEKCEFETQQTEYLGHIISPGKVQMDPGKVAGVTDWPVPCCKRDLQAFLGFANFYRRFIKDFAKIATPLNRLTGLAEWTWGQDEQTAFEGIKRAITSAPVLAIPNDDDPFKVECDASKFAVGAELSQKQGGIWKPIAFLSKSLSPAERNYEIYDRELLAIMTALDEWRHFLKGARHTFEIHTDHKNLEYFRKPQRLNHRQARWVVELQDFDFVLLHKPGKSMTKPDALSRRPDHTGSDDQNEDVIMLKPEWFRITAIDGTDAIVKECLKHIDLLDRAVLEQLGTNGDFEQTEDGLVYRRGKLVVPNDSSLRGRVIAAHHDSVLAGHPGATNTQNLISRSYWWPSLRQDVRKYVKGCHICQTTKIDRRKRAAPLHPNPVPDRNWQYISVDMITHLPPAHGYNAILVIVDMKSKDYIAIPCTDSLTSEGFVNLLIKHVVSLHGLPEKIWSDRGSLFVSTFTRDLYRKLGIKGNPSTAYHPQTDGQTERMNQEIETYLRIFINHRQDDWPDWLPLAAFAYRNRVHSATKQTPFFMTHGHHPYTGVETHKPLKNETAEQFAKRMKTISQQASAALSIAKEAMKRKYDRHRREPQDYRPGDLVYVDSFHIRTDRPSKKLEDKRYGPFQILEKIGASAYRLKLPRKWKAIHNVFNEVQLLPAHPPEFPNQPRPEVAIPDILDSTKEPEEILDSKVVRGGLQYLVKWKGLPRSENTWEKRTDLVRSHKSLLDTFHRENPTAPRMPTIVVPPRADNRAILRAPNWEWYSTDSWKHWDSQYGKWKLRQFFGRLRYASRGLDAREGGNVTN
ncbi:hypothetical protein NUW54_g3696 [Trametes sanguinea]|uniref:Uncharacterized protein n=1 Tax=Trametes sanguinea TaxID=158606 RepID=A0ACC1Q012_9APHY|nr:hypothetical protein NUW54_g3696 [Trametes sanguinea]